MISKILQTAISNSILGWKRPVHLILHVTSYCNARCGMCFTWRRLNKGNKDLTLEEIKKIAQILNKLIFLDISGGEPFLRPDLEKILVVFEKFSPGVYVNLPTNCLLSKTIENKTHQILKKTNLPVSLNLSLDGLEKTHDRIRGRKGNFAKVRQTFERLSQIKKDYPRLSLKISTCVSKQNFSELGKLADFVQKKMKGVDFHTLILVRGNPRDQDFTLPPLEELVSKKKTFFNIWQNYNYGKNLGLIGDKVANVAHRYFLNLYLQTLREKKMALPCLAGRAHAVIYANGDLSLCELRPPIGNLRKVNFDFWKLWSSPGAEKQRQEISQNRCFCTHGCNWTDNVFFNSLSYPKIGLEFLKQYFD